MHQLPRKGNLITSGSGLFVCAFPDHQLPPWLPTKNNMNEIIDMVPVQLREGGIEKAKNKSIIGRKICPTSRKQ